jgi:mannose-6-phosphate isomerase-like protein (cupin superfamily)
MVATPTEQQLLWFLDTLVTVRVPHGGGSDGISVLESFAPHGDSPPPHVHHTEDEVFHVLEGELRFRIGVEDVRVGAGETFLAPKGVPHSYRVESPAGGRWLVITTRGDFERLVRSLSRPAPQPELPPPSGPPTRAQAEALAAACLEHGIELVGPPPA